MSTPSSAPAGAADLADRAAAVLRANDLGGWTKAAPRLYPHQWSWDSAFIATGWAHLDLRRAAEELRTLFNAQWATGMVPHIVFNPNVAPGSYFPDADRWATARLAAAAPPAPPHTSGICQPPVHAIAAWEVWRVAERTGTAVEETLAFLRELYPKLFAWHRYLATERDPDGSGLVTIYHPWESGADNSPAWDAPMAAVEVGDLPPYERFDLKHVEDASQRPTMAEYDRYLWLVDELQRVGYEDSAAAQTHPFRVKGVFFSGCLVAANEALLSIAELVDAPDDERQRLTDWAAKGRRALDERWDDQLGLCLDYDLVADRPIPCRVIGGFAPLIAGGMTPARQAAVLATFDSPDFTGHPDLRWPLPPSTSPRDPGFRARSYWRGPTWPFMHWFLWWSLIRAGEDDRAARLRHAALEQLAVIDFAEYVEPFTGETLGSLNQSWSAAAALDWLARGDGA